TFSLFSDTRDQNPLGIPPLNGELFSYRAIPDLEATQLYNHDLLKAIRRLSLFREDRILHRINYSALDVEELGSVYESLLDFQPLVEKEPEGLRFELHEGGERKTTGSYYTRPELVRELIQSALVPVIEDRLAEPERQAKGKPEAEVKSAKERAILNIAVCDPACGSGHFLLEAARRLGRELARIRTGQDEPGPEDFHLAVRDAISHCIYGVDMNPLAVDLCKLALWLEGHWIGKPLSFLDHRIKCGNSLIGLLDPSVLEKGIPDEAFNPVTGDDKKVAAAYKKRNKKERETLLRRFDFDAGEHLHAFAKAGAEALDFAEDKPEDVRRKEDLYRKAREQKVWLHDWTAANLWTAAFFVPLTKHDDPVVSTHETFMDYLLHGKDRPQMTGYANALCFERRFFHWRLEFPEVFAKGGFDVVLGNPPWERIKLQEEEFWADDPYIATAPNKAERTKRIEEHRKSDDPVKRARVARFDAARHAAEAASKFIREGKRFPLTAVGDINTYALFAELARTLLNRQARAGIIVPTGIATDDTNKEFFGHLNREQVLPSFFDFENREAIFPGVHRSYKFSLFTISARPASATTFACYLTRTEQIRDAARRFELAPEDFALLNPNTRTCPIFRTRADADLTKKIYGQVPILVNERTNTNPWGIEYLRMLDMSNDSELFETAAGDGSVPLYEGKMVQAYDHRAASVITNVQNLKRPGQPVETTLEQHRDPNHLPRPQYWVPEGEVRDRLPNWYSYKWFLGFKSVTSPTNERTFIATLLPWSGVSNSMPLILTTQKQAKLVACLLANLNSLVFDYVARQKVGGVNLNFFIINQLATLPPGSYELADIDFISSRVLELVYTAFDMKVFARDMGHDGHPFLWDENGRAILRAALDAYFAHLYGVTRDELRYILDPKDVFGEDFPSETFRGLKENEEQRFGEYRTRRLVLAAYDELAKTDRFAGEKRESAIEAPKGRSMVPVPGSD
ncbi:MAG: N-6 DNA methylase, partial [Acidobacteria bacterium]|nr:N-6 DNA methylase [Acidobacteriota bacterium]